MKKTKSPTVGGLGMGLSVTKAVVSTSSPKSSNNLSPKSDGKKPPSRMATSRTSPPKKPTTPSPTKKIPAMKKKAPEQKKEKKWVGKITVSLGLVSAQVPVRHDGLGDSDIHVTTIGNYSQLLESAQLGQSTIIVFGYYRSQRKRKWRNIHV
jgi:cytoskeletal protein RodZ